MQLSPLQSRLAASAAATVLLIILYLSLFNPQFALAQDVGGADSSPIILEESTIWERGASSEGELEMRDAMYEPEFQAFDRSILGRQAASTTSLTNNVPAAMNIASGATSVFAFDSSQLATREATQFELRGEPAADEADPDAGETKPLSKRAGSTVYISANTCSQPSGNSTTSSAPPQLTLYVSNSTDNTSPGPSADASQQEVLAFTEGAVMYNFTTSNSVYVAVSASNVTSDFTGQYNVQIAASVNGWYHSYNETNTEELFWVDSDTKSVLLITQNLTKSREKDAYDEYTANKPYVMFAQNVDNPSINGMRHSYCGLNNNAQIAAVRNGQTNTQVTTGITRRGAGGYPKQQFYFDGLNSSATYLGILAKNIDNSSNTNVVGGGGSVFRATQFETKSSYGNCALVFNLTFCRQVAYAVPSNNQTFANTTALGEFYDNYAQQLYDGFNKSMQLIPCEASDSQQYSLVRNCSTCHAAYKDWLCSVTIPRCEDFTNNASYLQPREINGTFPDGSSLPESLVSEYSKFRDQLSYQTSRNPLIDSVVKPGPYKEVLPCEELCYDLVQSCPASMGFTCPRPWNTGFNTSYGTRAGSNDGNVTCNYPGSFHFYSGSAGIAVSWLTTAGLLLVTMAAVW